MNATMFYVLFVVFLATLIRSAFGFGEALVAVPLLALRMPVEVAAPLAVLMSVTVAAVILVQDRAKVHLRSAAGLVVSAIFGIPVGLGLLLIANTRVVNILLAVVIIAFAAYSLLSRRRPIHLENDHKFWLPLCGFVSGVLGGAYGMNGPPLAIYGAMRRWSAQHFRATLQAYFLPASLCGLIGYALAGLWTMTVTRYFLYSLPVSIVAIFLGRWINHRMSGEGFLNYIYVGLIGIGLVLLVQAGR
jgi:uncharacterized membrane protein YfcA